MIPDDTNYQTYLAYPRQQFDLPLTNQVNLLVLQCFIIYMATKLSRWPTTRPQPVCQETVLYASQYYSRWLKYLAYSRIYFYTFDPSLSLQINLTVFPCFFHLQGNITVNETYTPILTGRPRNRRMCPGVFIKMT